MGVMVNINGKICQQTIVVLAFLFLFFPNFLFFVGWFSPWLAVILIAGFFACLWRWLSLVGNDDTLPSLRVDAVGMVLVIGLLLYSVLLGCGSGLIGCFETDRDINIFRQAFLCHLTDVAWPVVLPDGREMSYYLGGDLPGAFFGRISSTECAHHVLLCLWTSCIFLVACCCWFCRVGRLSCIAAFLICFYPDIVSVFSALFKMEVGLSFFSFIGRDPLLGYNRSWFALYNSLPYACLVASLLGTVKSGHRILAPLLIALLLPLNPLAAVALFPLALYHFYKDFSFRDYQSVLLLSVPLMVGISCAVYYLRSEGTTEMHLAGNILSVKSCTWNIHLLVWSIPLLLPLLLKKKMNAPIVWAMSGLLFVQLLYVGDPRCNRINEFCAKNTYMFAFVALAACASQLALHWKTWGREKYVSIFLSVIWLPLPFISLATVYRGNHSIDDAWNGQVSDPVVIHLQKIPPCKEPVLPILIREGGASEHSFPGCLLPKAREASANEIKNQSPR